MSALTLVGLLTSGPTFVAAKPTQWHLKPGAKCRGCERPFSPEHFYIRGFNKNGNPNYASECKICSKARMIAYTKKWRAEKKASANKLK